MRRFLGYRPNPPAEYLETGTANPPDQVQYEGVVFSDGTLAVRWLTDYRSTSVWANWSDFDHVHGHPEYGTRIVWLDEDTAGLPEQRGTHQGGWKADLMIVDDPMPRQILVPHEALGIDGDCPDCGLPWRNHLRAAQALDEPTLVDLIRKSASQPPPPGMTWSLAYEKATGRRRPELDELIPKSGTDPLSSLPG